MTRRKPKRSSLSFDFYPALVRYWEYKRMFKKLALASLWFFTVPLVLLSTLFLFRHNKISANSANLAQNVNIPSGIQLQTNEINGQVLGAEVTDLRIYIVSNFLKNTPLEDYSEHIVQTSDKYDLDYRLIPAIAMKESGGGVAARNGSYNAWGFENGRTNFNSWDQAISSVAKTLKEKYVDKGLVTPEQIMPVYAPPQIFTGGKWAKDINFFFSQLESL